MEQTLFHWSDQIVRSEELDFIVKDLTKIRANTHRVLTDLDLLGGVSSVVAAAPGSTPNANGLSITTVDDEVTIQLQPANGSNPGAMTSGVQTFGGNKTFNGQITAANLSGNNSGDSSITLSAVGATPNVNGLTVTNIGQDYTVQLQPANATNPGALTAIAQNIGGNKTLSGISTFTNDVNCTALTTFSTGDVEDVSARLLCIGNTAPNDNKVFESNITFEYFDALEDECVVIDAALKATLNPPDNQDAVRYTVLVEEPLQNFARKEHLQYVMTCNVTGGNQTPVAAPLSFNEGTLAYQPTSVPTTWDPSQAAVEGDVIRIPVGHPEGNFIIRLQMPFNTGVTEYTVLLKDGNYGGPYVDNDNVTGLTGTGSGGNPASGCVLFEYYYTTNNTFDRGIQLSLGADSYPTPATVRSLNAAGEIFVYFQSRF